MKCILCSIEPKDPREEKRGLHLNCAVSFIQDRLEKGIAADQDLLSANKALSGQVKEYATQVTRMQEEINILQRQLRDERYRAPSVTDVREQLVAAVTNPLSQTREQAVRVSQPAWRLLPPMDVYKILAMCVSDTNELSIQLHPNSWGKELGYRGEQIFAESKYYMPNQQVLHRMAVQMYTTSKDADGKDLKFTKKDVEAYQWFATFGPDPSKVGHFLIKIPNRPLKSLGDRFSLIELE